MKNFIAFLVFILLFSQDALANEACYDAREAEAEQGVRIHSELMVIGLNCAHMADANGNNLYAEHQNFTKKHEELFATYEKILMDNMRISGEKNPEKSLHTLRTNFASKVSHDAAEMRPDIFCKEFTSRIERASEMDEKSIRKWAATPFKEHPVSKPLCENKIE